jgi:exonuclease III
MDKFRIVSWNCHYGFTLKKLTAILEYSPDILVVQECRKNDFDVLKSNWNYKNWYNDDLNQEESKLGVAIFSNEFKIHFSEIFNRKYRYVVPYTISKWCAHEPDELLLNDEIVFTLFTIWTKKLSGPCLYDIAMGKKPYGYHHNVIEAMNSPEYRQYSNTRHTMLIGDFNTGSNQEDDVHRNRYKELTTGLKDYINVAQNTKEEYKETCYNKGKFFTNDFCFVSKNFEEIAKPKISVLNNWQEDENGKKSWKGFSDHCPIVIDVAIHDFDVLAETEATDNEKNIK